MDLIFFLYIYFHKFNKIYSEALVMLISSLAKELLLAIVLSTGGWLRNISFRYIATYLIGSIIDWSCLVFHCSLIFTSKNVFWSCTLIFSNSNFPSILTITNYFWMKKNNKWLDNKYLKSNQETIKNKTENLFTLFITQIIFLK